MSLSHSPKIVRENLSLLLDPANTKSYPGTGTDWFDLSGNANHATLTATPTFSGGTVTWNGTTQYATITANQTSLNFAFGQTVMIWMKRTDDPYSGRRNPWDQAYGGYGTWTHEPAGTITTYYGINGGNAVPYTSASTASTTTGVWYCMCITRDSSLYTRYQNGLETAQGNHAYEGFAARTTANIRIANGYVGYWVGEMGPVLVYNRALKAHEVLQNFNAHRTRFGL